MSTLELEDFILAFECRPRRDIRGCNFIPHNPQFPLGYVIRVWSQETIGDLISNSLIIRHVLGLPVNR